MMHGVWCLLFLLSVGTGQSAEEAAQSAAESWLSTIDSRNYGASWEEASSLFRAAVTKENWERTISATRDPLGAVHSRELSSRTYARTLPAAPDGEYVVLQYDTVFENKRAAVETVTPMLDEDGHWRVSGYYIK